MLPWPRNPDPATKRRADFERLCQEHAGSLYGAALRMARNPDDAHDLTQDTLVQAYGAFDRFRNGSNFRAWLLRILTNRYISRYRRDRRVTFDTWDENDTLEALSHAAVTSDEPEPCLLRDVMDSEVEAALTRLSEGVRLAVLLVDVEELSYEAAAVALEVPVGTVRSRLNRGREKLRGYLAEYARERRLL